MISRVASFTSSSRPAGDDRRPSITSESDWRVRIDAGTLDMGCLLAVSSSHRRRFASPQRGCIPTKFSSKIRPSPLRTKRRRENAIPLSHRIFVQRSTNMPKNENKNQGTVAAAGADSAGPLPKMKREQFEKELNKLQVELTRLQAWTVAEGARIIVVFEGRDTAGKGGVISRITQRVSPRVFKHVALPAPSNRERSQLYMQRYS